MRRLEVIVIRTKKKTNFEIKLRKKTITSGCAQGTLFGDVMENFDKIKLSKRTFIKKDWIYDLSKKINNTPSLYLKLVLYMGVFYAIKIHHYSTWRMWVVIMQLIKLLDICS